MLRAQVALVSRYWTKIFAVFVFLSYALVYPYFVLYPLFEESIDTYDVTQYGVAYNVFANPTFWFIIILVNLVSFGHRYIERGAVWLFRPQVRLPAVRNFGPRSLSLSHAVCGKFDRECFAQDMMILSEFERLEGHDADLGWQTESRLDMLSSQGGVHQNGTVDGGMLHANGSRFGKPGKKGMDKQNSLLSPEVEMSHSTNFL